MSRKLSLLSFTFSAVLLGMCVATPGCANPERKAAQSIDHTGDIIAQSSAILAADKDLKRYPIVVDGFHNAMRLKGQVATPAQKARAEKIVWAIQGVTSVENDLDVVPAASLAPKPASAPSH